MSMEPVAYLIEWGEDLKRVQLNDELELWLEYQEPTVSPLVRLPDAEARIAELERELRAAMDAHMTLTEMQGQMDRAEAAEALLKEAGPIIGALLDFMERHSRWWDGASGQHPAVTVEAARAIHDKIGVKDE